MGTNFFSENKLESATFATYKKIPDKELSELEIKYGVTLEKERFAGVDDGNIRIRIFAPNAKIDLYEIQDGHDLKSDCEVLISAGYAVENGVNSGDNIKIGGKDYVVAGTFLRPDYLYMVENESDDYKNVTSFFLAYMTENEFSARFGVGNINNKVIYGDETDEIAFRKQVNEEYFISGYLAATNNKRVTFVHEQSDMFIMSSWFILIIFPMLTVALVCILLGRRIRAEQKLIGTLSALGYEKSKLMRHYSLFALIPGVIGGFMTSVAAMILSTPFGSLGLADYEPMKPEFHLSVRVAAAGIVIPALIYYIAAMLRVRRLLAADTVKLLAGQVGNDAKSRRIMSRKKSPVKYKFAVSQIVGSPGRSFVIFLGIFLGAMIVAFAFSFIDSVKAVGVQVHSEFGNFKYEYFFNLLKEGKPKDGEAVLAIPYEDNEARRFTLIGLDNDAELWNKKLISGEIADTDNGFYITTLFEEIFDIHEGDSFTFHNIATLEEKTVKIDGVIKNGYQSYLLTSREKVAEIAGVDSEMYNAVLADKSLNYKSEDVTEIISDKTYETQMQNVMKSMGGLIYAFMIIGMIVCVASLYATINTMISENSHNISMLKILGYENKRINSMILSSNHLLLIPGITLGILAAHGIMVWYCAKFVAVESIIIPAKLYPQSVLYTAFITAASYFISLLLLRYKVDCTDMIEALKDGRE